MNLTYYSLKLVKETTIEFSSKELLKGQPATLVASLILIFHGKFRFNYRHCEVTQKCITEVLKALKSYTKGLYHKFYWLDMLQCLQTQVEGECKLLEP